MASRGDNVIWFLDRSGGVLGSLGRNGDGPGEFRSIGQIVMDGNTLIVSDPVLDGVTEFHEGNGRWRPVTRVVRQAPISPREGPAVLDLRLLGVFADGAALLGVSPTSPLLRPTDLERYALVRQGRDEADRSVFATVDFRHLILRARLGGAREFVGREPLGDFDLFRLSASGRYLGILRRPQPTSSSAATVSLELLNLDGGTVWKAETHYRASPVTRADLDEWLDVSSAGIRTGSDEFRRALAAAVYKPRFKSMIESLLVGDDGAIWVQRRDSGGTLWDIFRGGRKVSEALSLPRNASPLLASRDQITVVETLNDGSQHLTTFRVAKSK